ncbi:MAG: sugar ABC transporter substrate-binding protein, partial [Nocardioides sp.]
MALERRTLLRAATALPLAGLAACGGSGSGGSGASTGATGTGRVSRPAARLTRSRVRRPPT